MSSKLEAFLNPADFKLEGILTFDNKKIDSYFVNYINGSIYQFYNNSNDAGQNYEHILILFLTEEDRFLKEIREIRKIKMIENGKNFDGEDVTKTTELDNMKLAYYCDVHDKRKIKETMLVFSSYNMKASNVKKEANELLSRRQQENSLDSYSDSLLKLSEDLKNSKKSELFYTINKCADINMYECILFWNKKKLSVFANIENIAKYIIGLVNKDNVIIYCGTDAVNISVNHQLNKFGYEVMCTDHSIYIGDK